MNRRVRVATALLALLALVGGCHVFAAQGGSPPIPRGDAVDAGSFALNVRRLPSRAPADAARPALVMLHGFGASNVTWLEIEDSIRAAAPLVQIDLRGFGYSDKPRDDHYGVDDQARAVVTVIRQLGLRDITLLGHSFGGGVALATTLLLRRDHPDVTVHGLVLIDAAAYEQELPFFIDALRNPLTRWFAFTFTTASQRANFTLQRITRVPTAATPERVARYAYFHALPGANHALVETAEHMVPEQHDEFIDAIRTITQPTLILWGERDPVIPVAYALRFDEDLPNSERHVLAQTGHVPHEERPAEVAGAIVGFLTRLPAPGAR